eukprot:SAG31_NODE_325_length_17671_cov_9.902743_9_plen_115_part_00
MAARPPRLLRSLCAHLSTAAAAAASAEEAEAEEPAYTLQQVREHQSAESCWVAICDGVYDFTAFVDRHPGGARALLRHAGTDASDVFTGKAWYFLDFMGLFPLNPPCSHPETRD